MGTMQYFKKYLHPQIHCYYNLTKLYYWFCGSKYLIMNYWITKYAKNVNFAHFPDGYHVDDLVITIKAEILKCIITWCFSTNINWNYHDIIFLTPAWLYGGYCFWKWLKWGFFKRGDLTMTSVWPNYGLDRLDFL